MQSYSQSSFSRAFTKTKLSLMRESRLLMSERIIYFPLTRALTLVITVVLQTTRRSQRRNFTNLYLNRISR